VDAAVVVLVMVTSVLPFSENTAEYPQTVPAWAWTLPVVSSAGLAVRRRWPVTVLGWTLLWAVAAIVVLHRPGVAMESLVVALYTVARMRPRSVWLPAALCEGTVAVASGIATGEPFWTVAVANFGWTVAGVAVGVAVRNRMEYLAAVEAERARVVEQSKEQEARRRVAEERVRIARELHDVLAHSIAVINVQSGVAAHLIRQQPAAAQQALWHVNDASHAALAELRATLGILRQDGDASAPTGPVPDLGRLGELVEEVRVAGLGARTRFSGDLSRIPAEVGLVAYRVVQEALTNVLKHSRAGTVDVTVESDGQSLRIEVRDDGVGLAGQPGAGYGRIGMRERVQALGGTFTDGPLPVGYRVQAVIPLATPTDQPVDQVA
jgi:signal transduction histidine kinase